MQIRIGGRLRPINFTFEIAYHYERTTGRKYLADLRLLFAELTEAARQINTDDVEQALACISVVRLADLVHCALEIGAQEAGQPVDFTPAKVGAWLMTDPGAMKDAFDALQESMPRAAGEEDGEEPGKTKQPKATPMRSTGKN